MLIVGGGIAGMSLAIRMRGLNWEVDLVELDPQWRVYGTGISITAPTLRAFRHLGIIDAVMAGGYCSQQGVKICAPSGQVIVEHPISPIEPGLPAQGGIMRPVLHAILADRTRASGTAVRLGVTLQSYTQSADTVRAVTSDGLAKDYALLVAADGAFSKVRTMVFPEAPAPKYTGQYCWRLVADRPAEIEGCHFYMAGPITAGVMPTSQAQMYMFLLQPLREKVRIDEATQWRQLKELMGSFRGLIGRLRDGLSADSGIVCRPLEAILLPRPWHRGRVAFIGDAVHATTPHLASGAGIAVEDALVLSEILARQAAIETALEQFESRRWERCRMVVENSVKICEMEQEHADPRAIQALMATSEQLLRAAI
jgi:2-polyprenyl-6-methoxyphenol hydroxylase-like FAD-dependent oxidoreductase